MIPAEEIIEKKNQTLQSGVDGINMFLIRTLSLIMGISIYGTIIFAYTLLFLTLIIVFIWFCSI